MGNRDIIMAVCGLVFLLLQFFMTNNYRKVTDQFGAVIQDFRNYLDKQNDILNKKLDDLQKHALGTSTHVQALCEFHNKFDADGRPMWFIPLSQLELQKKTAATVNQVQEALEGVVGELKVVRSLLEQNQKAG